MALCVDCFLSTIPVSFFGYSLPLSVRTQGNPARSGYGPVLAGYDKSRNNNNLLILIGCLVFFDN